MISYLGSLDQFSPAAGRAGRCRQMSLCVGSTRRALARQPRRAAWAARGLRALPFPSAAPARHRRSGLRKSSDRNPRLFAGWEGVASLGLSLPLGPPPASFLQRGWAGSSLGFLSPFVLRTAGGVFQPVNFSALPQFKEAPSDCSQGLLAGTLSNAAGSSPFRPHLLAAGAGVWGTFLLGVAFRHVICGPYLISPPG